MAREDVRHRIFSSRLVSKDLGKPQG